MISNAALSSRLRAEYAYSKPPLPGIFKLTGGGKVCKLPAGPAWQAALFPSFDAERGPAVLMVFLTENLGHDVVSKLITR